MANRLEIICSIGRSYHTSNIESGEFSYPKAFREKGLAFDPIKKKSGKGTWQFLDIRFVLDGVSLLIETKSDADKWPTAEEQIAAYVEYEKRLTGNKIIAMVANTADDRITVWKSEVEDDTKLDGECSIRTMPEYVAMFDVRQINNKEEVMRNTYRLNELLHRHGIEEKLRSQFVGTCLLAIKNGLVYDRKMKTSQIIVGMRAILEDLLEGSLMKAEKLTLIDKRVLQSQKVRDVSSEGFCLILDFVRDKIYPFINDKSTAGQDLLNLFFITFNKYVGKSDKNQAFTPDHITDFMSKLCDINRSTVVLDMTCGSGSFLVRAMTQALADCRTKAEEDAVKRSHIYGVEYDELVYGLATTNMLIHSDGNSNIVLGSCFEKVPCFIADGVKFNVVLMNPPYNAMATQVPTEFSDTWGKSKQDPSNGLYFVKFILDQMNKHGMFGKLAVLLPMSCAIGSKNRVIQQMKRDVLMNNTLDAVFSLPKDVFYPGSSTCACCMLFDVGVPHESAKRETFFAYCKDDGFKTRKKLGRVEQMNGQGDSLWDEIEKKWLLTYRNRDVIPGFSTRHMVDGDDEWLCEAYMETDYSTLSHDDFQQTVNDYLAYLVKTGNWRRMESYIEEMGGEPLTRNGESRPCKTALDTSSWKTFAYPEVFDIRNGFYNKKPEHIEKGRIPFLGAVNGNNGVTEYYTYEEIESSTKTGDEPNSPIDQKIFPPNAVCVTNNGSVGFAYFQPSRFTCSHDVNPLYRRSGEFNAYTGLFVATVIMHDRYRWEYGRKWRPARMVHSTINLPATVEGEPDWQFMEDYIKSLRCGDRLH